MEELPEDLKKRYEEILSYFSSISDDWKKYPDKIIPQDNDQTKKIINFLIDLCSYISVNFKEMERDKFQSFLSTFHEKFYYGEHGDDNNYLDFEQTIEDEPLSYHLHEFDEFFTRKSVNEFKTKLQKLLTKL